MSRLPLPLALALAALRRRPGRAALLGATIALGAFFVVLHHAAVRGVERQLIDNLVVAQFGDLSVATGSRTSDFGSSAPLPDPPALIAAAQAALPGARIEPTLSRLGVASAGGRSTTRAALWGEGTRVRLGAAVARKLGVAAGSRVALALPRPGGGEALHAEAFVVDEVLPAGAPWQDYFVYLPLEAMQRLADAPGTVAQLRIVLPRGADLAASRARLAAALGPRGVRVETFREAGRFYVGMVSAAQVQLAILDAVVMLAVALGIGATQALAVHERRREIGAMTALGTPRVTILGAFLAEAGLLGLACGAIGAAAGTAIAAWLARGGIALPAEAFRWMIGGTRLYPAPGWGTFAGAVAEAVVAAMLAGAFPAARAAAADPAQALAGEAR